MKREAVSIVLPAYQEEAGIEATLRAVLELNAADPWKAKDLLSQRADEISTRNQVGNTRTLLGDDAETTLAFLDAIAATHAPVKLPRATLYLWLPIPGSFANSLDFTADLLDRTGVVVSPGSGFGNAGEGYVRIALCVDEARMREAGRRIVEAGYRW